MLTFFAGFTIEEAQITMSSFIPTYPDQYIYTMKMNSSYYLLVSPMALTPRLGKYDYGPN